ncbi:MAG: GNAT family N-acetyltransferase [Verrucomicrobia bacterium]|nr:GNAT family N-acetyltransferase [Verrucomicrobiota bacterium]
MILLSSITLRPATRQDLDFLDKLYTTAMRPYFEKINKWNPLLFRITFDESISQVIEYDGQSIGFLKVRRDPEAIFLGDIQLMPEFRNQGIGTHLIRALLKEAATSKATVWLKVLKGNPALSLYERLGFTVSEETEGHYRMVHPGFTIAR